MVFVQFQLLEIKILKKEERSILIENTIKLNSDFALHPRLKGFSSMLERKYRINSSCNKYSIYSKITF
jgi:hypothetical protein